MPDLNKEGCREQMHKRNRKKNTPQSSSLPPTLSRAQWTGLHSRLFRISPNNRTMQPWGGTKYIFSAATAESDLQGVAIHSHPYTLVYASQRDPARNAWGECKAFIHLSRGCSAWDGGSSVKPPKPGHRSVLISQFLGCNTSVFPPSRGDLLASDPTPSRICPPSLLLSCTSDFSPGLLGRKSKKPGWAER